MAPVKSTIKKASQLVSKSTPLRKVVPIKRKQHKDNSNSENSEFQASVRESLQKILESSTSMQTTIATLQNTVSEIHTNQLNVETRVETLETRVEALETKLEANNCKKLERELEKAQIELKKLNLIIVGLHEEKIETPQNLIDWLHDFINNALELRNIEIDMAYRVGVSVNNKPRNIIVKFARASHRVAVFNNRNKLRDKDIPVYINEDFPPDTLTRRYYLRMECKKAHSLGKVTRLLGDQLIIDNITYGLDENRQLEVLKVNKQRRRTDNDHTHSGYTKSAYGHEQGRESRFGQPRLVRHHKPGNSQHTLPGSSQTSKNSSHNFRQPSANTSSQMFSNRRQDNIGIPQPTTSDQTRSEEDVQDSHMDD